MPSDRPVSEPLKNLIKRFLEKEPKQRATIEELKNNEWVNEGFAVNLSSEEANTGILGHLR